MAVVACLPGISAATDFEDTFENYNLGEICGQAGPPGGWEEWEGSVDVCGLVTDEQANSGTKSLKIIGDPGGSQGLGDDTVQRMDEEGGVWTFKIMTYVPGDATGTGSVILLNTYPASVNQDWSLVVALDSDSGAVERWSEIYLAPLIVDRWVEFRAEIDIDNDLVDYYYNGEKVDSGVSWINGIAPGGLPRIQALDLYGGEPGGIPPGTTGFYLDDVSLKEVAPETGCMYVQKKNSKAKKGCTLCYKKGDTMMSGQACEKVKDCTPKKLKEKKYDCLDPEAPPEAYCKKLKAKRDSCIP